jgi:hypothetical protein
MVSNRKNLSSCSLFIKRVYLLGNSIVILLAQNKVQYGKVACQWKLHICFESIFIGIVINWFLIECSLTKFLSSLDLCQILLY